MPDPDVTQNEPAKPERSADTKAHVTTIEHELTNAHKELERREGAIVELQWNGGALPLQVVTADQRSLGVRVEVEGTETPNLLRLRTLAGGRVRPGMVELVD